MNKIPEDELGKGDILFVVEKLYEDGWHWYCGYETLEEAKFREKIVIERDHRQTRIRWFILDKQEVIEK